MYGIFNRTNQTTETIDHQGTGGFLPGAMQCFLKNAFPMTDHLSQMRPALTTQSIIRSKHWALSCMDYSSSCGQGWDSRSEQMGYLLVFLMWIPQHHAGDTDHTKDPFLRYIVREEKIDTGRHPDTAGTRCLHINKRRPLLETAQ